jgi:arylsulfatase A-like enzyme
VRAHHPDGVIRNDRHRVSGAGSPCPGEVRSPSWELYDGSSDWTQARDLAKEQPGKLRELQRLFLIAAARYNVLPLDDRSFERVLPDVSGRPTLIQGDKQLPVL